MKRTILAATLAALLAAGAAQAQAPQRVERADDLPRFSYPVQGELEAIVRDPQRFQAFAANVRRDTEQTLAKFDIADTAKRRELLGVLLRLDMLDGKWDDALRRADDIRKLEDKPADKLLSGINTRAMVAAVKATGTRQSPQFAAEVGRSIAQQLAPMPFLTVRNDVQQIKAGLELLGESLALGRVRNVLQPVATQTGAVSSDLAPAIIGARYTLEFTLPLKDTLLQAYSSYLAANKVEKPDIWAARDVALPAGRPYATVPIVIWDSGVDVALFPGRQVLQGGKPALVAFDLYNKPSTEPLKPLPPATKGRIDELLARSKGLSDLQSNIESSEATDVKKLLSGLAPDQYKSTIEELRVVGVYEHGTHVAGIAMAGNPYARVANARIEFGHTLLPDPCPTPELQKRGAENFAKYGEFIRASKARVVNMSWGGDLRSYEVELEQCGIGKDVAERKKIARGYFDMHYKALKAMFQSLPDVLFVTAAGNSGDDATFNDSYPVSISLPNMVAVGAVDKAGDEASFTSYGPTVLLHANGFQVDSVVPGGKHIALSGTSMASPQVAGLAAKMLAVKPSLKPAEVIDILRKTAERSEDGRRTLIHPAKALAAVGYKP